jgi:hypothetical protein
VTGERVALVAAAALAAAALLPPSAGVPGRLRLRRRRRSDGRPSGLVAMERRVGLAVGSAGEAHERLRPLLREIARGRLAAAGVDLDRRPDAAREMLGPEAWSLVRDDVAAPADRHAHGVDPAALEAAVSALERIGGGR